MQVNQCANAHSIVDNQYYNLYVAVGKLSLRNHSSPPKIISNGMQIPSELINSETKLEIITEQLTIHLIPKKYF